MLGDKVAVQDGEEASNNCDMAVPGEEPVLSSEEEMPSNKLIVLGWEEVLSSITPDEWTP